MTPSRPAGPPFGALAIGAQVGAYRIVGELGSGGMGTVYRASHALLDRPAAIKVLRAELGASISAIDRFATEARAAAAIRHASVVEIYDYGITAAGSPYIAMELLEGVTLRSRIAARGRMPPHDAAAIVRRIADALAAAHERGVVHRDLKPENVFLVRDHRRGAIDHVKLIDFGIARREGEPGHGPAGVVLGTPAYMSPEQCRGDDCDHRADLYALGCIAFEMLTGHPPFGRGATGPLIAAHLRAPVPDLGKLAGVPPELARLVARLLAKHPGRRPRSALDAIAAIDRWQAARGPTRAPRVRWRIAAGMASPFAGLATWSAWWHRAPDALDEHAPDDAAVSHEHRLADGTARIGAIYNAPTEPIALSIGEISAVRESATVVAARELPTRRVRRQTAHGELDADPDTALEVDVELRAIDDLGDDITGGDVRTPPPDADG